MPALINTIANLSYDKGVVTFSLDNVAPGPGGVPSREIAAMVALRFEDLAAMLEFLEAECQKIRPIHSFWIAEVQRYYSTAPKSSEPEVALEEARVGRRIGP